MFKKVISVVSVSIAFVAGMVKKIQVAVVVAVGMLFATSTYAQSALDGFIATDATTGDPVADPSKVTTFLKNIVVMTYSSWVSFALIFVIVGLVCWILFKKR